MPPALAVKAAIARSQSRRHIAGGDGQTSALQSRGSLAADSSFATAETSDYLRAALRQPCVLQKQVRDTIEMLGGSPGSVSGVASSGDTTDSDALSNTTDDSDNQGDNDYDIADADYDDVNRKPGRTQRRRLKSGDRLRTTGPGTAKASPDKKGSNKRHVTANGNRKCSQKDTRMPSNETSREALTTRQTAAAMAEFLGVRNGMGRQASLPAALANISDSLTRMLAEQRTMSQTLQSRGLNLVSQSTTSNPLQTSTAFMGPVDVYSMPAGGPMSNTPANALRPGGPSLQPHDYRTVLASFTHTVTRLNALVSRIQAQCLDLAVTVSDARLLELERRSAAKRLVKEIVTHIDRAFSPDGGGALLQKQFYFDLSPTVGATTGSGAGANTIAGSPRGPYTVFLRHIVFSEYLNRLPMLQGDATPREGGDARSTITGQSNSRLRGLLPIHQKVSQQPTRRPVGAAGPETALYVCPVTQARRSDQRVRELHNFVGSRIGRNVNGYDELVVPIIEQERLQEGSSTCNLYLFIDCLNVVEIFSCGYLRPADHMAPASGGLHPAATDLLLHHQPALNAGMERISFGSPFDAGVQSSPNVEFVSSRLRYLVRCCLHSMTHIVSLLHPEVRADHILTHSHPVYAKIANVYEPTGIVRQR